MLFFYSGLIVALSFTLAAFNYSTTTKEFDAQHPATSNPDDFNQLVVFRFDDPPATSTRVPLPDNTILPRNPDDFRIVDDFSEINDPLPNYLPVDEGIEIPGRVDEGVDPGEDTTVLLIPPVLPEFPGGEAAMMKWLSENCLYPQAALRKGYEGRVVLTFIVEKDGTLSNVSVLRSAGWGFDEVCLECLSKMPRWKPGEQNFRKVRVRYNLPISFNLR